ncbi:DNA polymerase III subunit alpha [Acetohalobium arabaticum]|uniref:DNA polymerase III subunit alpha n=1 Tax=Acetohalobium arabaticum (strain ATCC 49924 / DSM 5501 / Z-7288) TaxID=574087 RepID=D9QS87_ACEAZ|nr:DNA polymerase III subunit alpha [Acetohalobium arabaticum]ADL13378.1 DNA polymerase III catalytic subunit, DnaE type [Acetohalobium arabaticum DSM 5501]
MSGFVHLHCHTEYSLLDGAARIGELVTQAADYGMPALAITDHGNMYGAVEFYKAAKDAGIKPIIGSEVYVAPESRFNQKHNRADSPYHLVLLAKNNQGYRNLLKLVSKGYLEGFYYKPQIDLELLRKYNEGLICLSGCLAGRIARGLLNEQQQQVKEMISTYQDIFGENDFYLELQDQGLRKEKIINHSLIELGEEMDVPLVATNDVHYLNQEDAQAHDVLLCIQTGKLLTTEDRMKFPNDEFYLKSGQEMADIFSEVPQAIENTVEIAKRCNVELDFDQTYLPYYDVPEEKNLSSYLRELCLKGARKRYGEVTDEVQERLDYELEIINEMGYPAYFLIVWDFIEYAKEKGIMVGPGRGSAAGSLVSYVLGITDIDPLEHGLIFERFLNPQRVSMPDIDIDFCYQRRDEVIDYVTEKYGQDRVAQIITFGTMAARAVVRDVGRVLDLSYAQVDKIAKLIPFDADLDEALESSQELKDLCQKKDEIKELIDYAQKLEGLPRHASTHAAGVVISKEELTEYTPLQQNKGEVTTQYPMGDLEAIGLLKMDFLGLRTLTVINNTLEIIERTQGIKLDLDEIPLDDEQTYQLLQTGNTEGLFQIESNLFQRLIADLKPTRFEDLIALLALGRPGPLGSGMVDDFIKRRHGEAEVEYPHADLEEILEETYGVILYQEQVMRIANEIAGYSLGEADILRRGMGKKKPELLKKHRQKFIDGALDKGYSEELANELFDLMEYFGGYGFNKSHSAAYAFVSYRTAYLKTYYPVEYMAALLSSIMGNSDKVARYIEECNRMGIEVLPPDVNESEVRFTVVGDRIRFGLEAVKNVGQKAIEEIIRARQEEGAFESLTDFCQKVFLGKVNQRVIESLIKAGAFDSLGAYRSQMLTVIEDLYEQAHKIQKEKGNGQQSFGDFLNADEFGNVEVKLPEMSEYSHDQLLAMEREYLGLYISGHPIDKYQDLLAENRFESIVAIKDLADKEEVRFGGIINSINQIITKNGKDMAFLELEDRTGQLEVVVFPEQYNKFQELLIPNEFIMGQGRLDQNEEGAKLIAHSLQKAPEKKLYLKVKEISSAELQQLAAALKKFSGSTPVYLVLKLNREKIIISTSSQFSVKLEPGLENRLQEISGVEDYILA